LIVIVSFEALEGFALTLWGSAAFSCSGGKILGKPVWFRQAAMLAIAAGSGSVGCHCKPGKALAQ
jgi:hypothetical protein